jgi:hypothetical protein
MHPSARWKPASTGSMENVPGLLPSSPDPPGTQSGFERRSFAHAVEAWVLATSEVGEAQPDWRKLVVRLAPLQRCRLSLHLRQGRTVPVPRSTDASSEARLLLRRRADGQPVKPAGDAQRETAHPRRPSRRYRCTRFMFLAGMDTRRRRVSGAPPHA